MNAHVYKVLCHDTTLCTVCALATVYACINIPQWEDHHQKGRAAVHSQPARPGAAYEEGDSPPSAVEFQFAQVSLGHLRQTCLRHPYPILFHCQNQFQSLELRVSMPYASGCCKQGLLSFLDFLHFCSHFFPQLSEVQILHAN